MTKDGEGGLMYFNSTSDDGTTTGDRGGSKK